MKLNEKGIEKKLFDLANKLSNLSKKYIRKYAYDTGDLESSITVSNVKKISTGFEVEVFADSTKLGTKRNEKTDKKYPIYVHNGTKPRRNKAKRKRKGKTVASRNQGMKARPFLTDPLKLLLKKTPELYAGLIQE